MAAIAKEDTAKTARLEKEQEEVAQPKLEAHQGKNGKEKAIAKEEEAKATVITKEVAAEMARLAKLQEEEVKPTRNSRRRRKGFAECSSKGQETQGQS